ncbi:hypothetical protein P4O66_018376 [Electrophorus voltai]|uniref:Uncharacterized protein n=1 Tax=Electrophorus voltai TaxID=2609070 RepID=A0AAD8YPF1_9TELE|nr:hypothetical protein P4O66_018376 [Electrophorus voltai]
MDLENKLRVAKEELEKAALDKDIPKVPRITTTTKLPVNVEVMRRDGSGVKDCQMVKVGADCFQNQTVRTSTEITKMTGHTQPRGPGSSGYGSVQTSEDGKMVGAPKKPQSDRHN